MSIFFDLIFRCLDDTRMGRSVFNGFRAWVTLPQRSYTRKASRMARPKPRSFFAVFIKRTINCGKSWSGSTSSIRSETLAFWCLWIWLKGYLIFSIDRARETATFNGSAHTSKKPASRLKNYYASWTALRRKTEDSGLNIRRKKQPTHRLRPKSSFTTMKTAIDNLLSIHCSAQSGNSNARNVHREGYKKPEFSLLPLPIPPHEGGSSIVPRAGPLKRPVSGLYVSPALTRSTLSVPVARVLPRRMGLLLIAHGTEKKT